MADTLLVASDENLKQNPNLDLAQLVYSYEYYVGQELTVKAEEIKTEILQIITADNMLPYYEMLCAKFSWPLNEELVNVMKYALLT